MGNRTSRSVLFLAGAGAALLGGCDFLGGSPNMVVSSRNEGNGAIVTVKNQETAPLELRRVVVNGRDSDPACAINVFRPLGAGQETEVPVPSCGQVAEISVETDQGTGRVSFNAHQRSVETRTNNQPGFRTTTVRNVGPTQWTVNNIVVNGQTNDNQCNFRVFREVPPNSEIVVNTDTCGHVNSIEVITTEGSTSFTMSPPAPAAGGNAVQ